MTDRVVKYHPSTEPIPEGWELIHDLQDCHHGQYAVLIRYVGKEDAAD